MLLLDLSLYIRVHVIGFHILSVIYRGFRPLAQPYYTESGTHFTSLMIYNRISLLVLDFEISRFSECFNYLRLFNIENLELRVVLVILSEERFPFLMIIILTH